MKNNIIKYVIIGLGLLAAGIFLKNLFKDKPKQNIMIINDWKKDQNGCLKLRTEKLAIELIAKHNLNHSSKEKFITVFGEPNEKKLINDAEVLVYYFDTLPCPRAR